MRTTNLMKAKREFDFFCDVCAEGVKKDEQEECATCAVVVHDRCLDSHDCEGN